MELTHEFRVPVSVEQAWDVLTDVERIAPCMPGADLQEVEGDEYRGSVRVKVGPITAQYRGAASFVERDTAARKAVLRAEGRETRGQGNANATITATLSPDGDGTHVSVVTDLTITGKVAQFGRGVLVDVSSKLLQQFVDCLQSDVLSAQPASSTGGDRAGAEPTPAGPGTSDRGASATGGNGSSSPPSSGAAATAPTAPEGAGQAASPGVRRIEGPKSEPVDLLDAAGMPVAKRALPLLGAVAGLLLVLRLRRRRRRRAR